MRIATLRAGLVAPAAAFLMGLAAACSFGQDRPDYRAGSLPDENPRPVYSPDPSDPWNRIFHALFSRTVRLRLSGEFAEGTPLERVKVMGFPDLPVSAATFERIEGGDLAIEPLDGLAVHTNRSKSTQRVLAEPHFARLKVALAEALREESPRPPLHRALMQGDLWAAHDILFATRPPDEDGRGRKDELLGLLARLVKALSLSRREIEGLPDNYAQARLPFGLFAADGGWIEVEQLPERGHDTLADFRRAARVFLKPSAPPADRDAWLDGLRGPDAHGVEKFDALALVIQPLLIDADGVVAPTRLTHEVQVRTFLKGDDGKPSGVRLDVAELGRKLLLVDRRDGGLHRVEESDPAYLTASGNDYFFATAVLGRPGNPEAILTTSRKRCQSCHREDLGLIFTFSGHAEGPPLPVRRLDAADHERAREVSRLKMLRPDFAELKRRWDR